ncbi:MAG TPA: MFS transporter [Caulobacteraceae bacterium]|jgi:GPH family glycoside/pentoside/hexuronide:cation symporter|nr:MFS transporter [Caulobacteraceae bacterium]
MTNAAEEIIAPIGPRVDSHAARAEPLKLGTLAAYGSGMLVQDTLALGLGTLVLFYLTIFCGLSGAEAGIITGFALLVDSFVDPLAGSLSDNSRSRHGRRHPYMLLSALPIAIAFGLLFSIPRELSGPFLFVYALTMLMVVRVGLSFFQVPYIALGAELTDDYTERSTVVAARVLFTVVASLAAAFLAYGVFMSGPTGQLNRDAYSPFAWTCGGLVLLGAGLATFGTLNMRHRLHAAPEGGSQPIGRLIAEVAEVFRNRSFCILFAACLILFVGLGAAGALTLYANTYFWKLQPMVILGVTIILLVGYLTGVVAAGFASRSLEKRTVATIGIALIGIGQFFPAALKVSGVLPAAAAVPVLMAGALCTGIGAAAATIGFQSMMADAADEHEHLFGARREGLYFAGISFSAKASSGVGNLIAGLVLDLISFPHGLEKPGAAHAVATIPTDTIRDLGLLYGPGASVITAISVVTLTLYRRGRREHEEVRAALTSKRAG